MYPENSISRLDHFCARSSDRQSASQIRYLFEQRVDGKFTAQVFLPASLDPDIRHARSSASWTTKRAAKRDASFNAFKRIYEVGLVDDHLQPFLPDLADPLDEVRQEASLQAASPLHDPYRGLCRATVQAYYGYKVVFNDVSVAVKEFWIWLPLAVLLSTSFPLHLDHSTEIKVCIESTGLRLDMEYLDEAQRATTTLLSSAFDTLDQKAHDLTTLITPTKDLQQLHAWLEANEGEEPLSFDAAPYLAGKLVKDAGHFTARRIAEKYCTFDELLTSGLHRQVQNRGGDPSLEYVLARKLPKRRNFLLRQPTSQEPVSGKSHARVVPLQDCIVARLPACYTQSMLMMPSVLHLLELSLISESLRNNLLAPVGFKDNSMLAIALAASSARLPYDYQRFEFLGDCVLKFTMSMHLMSTNKLDPESFLTRKRSHLVSNARLSRIARTHQLDMYISTIPFTGYNWRPRYFEDTSDVQPRLISSKVLADVVEACIGASYLEGTTGRTEQYWQGVEQATSCLRVFYDDIVIGAMSDLISNIRRSEARSSSNEAAANYHFKHVEDLLGYKFLETNLLDAASPTLYEG